METVHEGWDLRFQTWRIRASHLTVQTLLVQILGQQWHDSDKPIKRGLERAKGSTPVRMQLPSKSGTTQDKISDFEIKWRYRVPALNSFLGLRDWPIYISEPFAERPIMEKVKIMDVAPEGSDYQRLVMIWSSSKPISSITVPYDAAIAGSSSQEVLSCQLYILLCVILGIAKADTISYFELACSRIDKIVSYLKPRLHRKYTNIHW